MRRFLHDGVLAGSAYPKTAVAFKLQTVRSLFRDTPAKVEFSAKSLEVRFVTDHKMDAGRFANNGWLQECPDPMTKISWDNTILVSPRLGKELGIAPGTSALQVVRVGEAEFPQGKENAYIGEVTINGRTVRGPMHIQPGLFFYDAVHLSGLLSKDFSRGRIRQTAFHWLQFPIRFAACTATAL